MKINKIVIVLKKIDWLLIVNISLLMLLGVVLIYSIALGSQSDYNFLNFKKQIVFFMVGLFFIFSVTVFLDYRSLIKYSTFFYILSVISLVSVLIFGKQIRGTTGWFDFGIFSIQPVEFVKIFLIIFLSKFFSDKAKYIGRLKYLILSSLGVMLLMFLVVMQPDFGSALVLFLLWLSLILITGIKKSHLMMIVVILLLSVIVLWFFIFQDYQKQRIEVFLNPALDPLGSGYNVSQALIAIGSGNLWGKGLTLGSQSQLKFLPESQTDFIFAVLAEELGLAGVLFLFILFMFLFYKLVLIAKKNTDNFAAYLVISICSLFFIQTVINIGGNLGLLPITGITLPFVSYGGSSLLTNCFLVGIVGSVVVRSN